MILSARLTWQNDGRRFTVTAASSEFVDAAALLGASFLLPPREA